MSFVPSDDAVRPFKRADGVPPAQYQIKFRLGAMTPV